MPLLQWSSFPVLVLGVVAVLEGLSFRYRSLNDSRGWRCAVWCWRPWALWAVLNILFRTLDKWAFNEPTTYPFYFKPWLSAAGWAESLQWLRDSPGLGLWSAVLLVAGAGFLAVCYWIARKPMTPGMTAVALAALLAFAFGLPLVYDGLPQGAEAPLENKGSFLNAWFDSGSTMLYCIPRIESKAYYLKHFQEIQPLLSASIHGVTHPPGASLALYWGGMLFGATGDISGDRLRYMLGTTFLTSLGVLAVFLLGRQLFKSSQIGLMGAALWVVKPAALAYNTFAPDAVYTVFYVLCIALIWQVSTAARRPWGSMVALGSVFYALAMLNFIWPMFVAIFGVALLIFAYRLGLRPAEWMLRGAGPVGLALAMLLWTCHTYHLDYIAIFRFASHYYNGCHPHGFYRPFMELVGGQVDLYLMAGSFCAYVFWVRFPAWLRTRPFPPQALFFLLLPGFQLFTILCLNGPAGEASRIWAWLPAVPLVVCAKYFTEMDRPRFYFLVAVAASMLQYYAVRLFLVALG